MKILILVMLYLSGCVAADAPLPKVQKLSAEGSSPAEEVRPAVCQCSPNFEELGCDSGDIDSDCVCNHEDNCRINPNCDRSNVDGDAFGDVCDEFPNTPSPETAVAALDARLDALEGAGTGAAIVALQYDIAALDAALAEIRTKYPAHFHGLLGLNGNPVGSSGDLSYSLPSDP